MSNSLSRQLRTTLFYALRTAFRLTPMPQATRDRLRQRFLDTRGHWVPEGPKGKAPTGELPRRPYVRSDERAIGYVPYEKGELPDPLPATLVAFYLPQFHTIPENDEWWGKGFTEWRNVARALPQFEGHHQPKLPGDLGFYDLRNVEVMHEQARLAREYGISAFCFYFYWFGGKTLLETPLRNWLNDKSIDLEFCLCWANEKWTRTWDGRGDEILIDQQHSPEDDIAFIEYVAEYMRDPRYLRVDGKPMLLVYRPGLFPDMAATALRWRRWCRDNGVGDIHLAYVQSFERPDPAEIGFDAAVEFPPNLSPVNPVTGHNLINPDFAGSVLDWTGLAEESRQRVLPSYILYRGITPGWDNEARRPARGRVYQGASPLGFGDWLSRLVRDEPARDAPDSPIFVNAWNEWAEGAVLEPDAHHGHAYLEAVRQALKSRGRWRPEEGACAILHAWHLEELREVLNALRASAQPWRLLVTTTSERARWVESLLQETGWAFRILIAENRGRDILPFLRAAYRLLLEGEDVVLKLHTKRSDHRIDGEEWRRQLLHRLLDRDRVAHILAAFDQDQTLGQIGPEGHLLRATLYSGGNSRWLALLRDRMAMKEDSGDDEFFAGSMFWVRLRSLAPLFECGLAETDFEEERGQLDGTLAHAIERIMGSVTVSQGYRLSTAAKVVGETPDHCSDYAFARRS